MSFDDQSFDCTNYTSEVIPSIPYLILSLTVDTDVVEHSSHRKYIMHALSPSAGSKDMSFLATVFQQRLSSHHQFSLIAWCAARSH